MKVFIVRPTPEKKVGVAFTSREYGVSKTPFNRLNLGKTDCDDAADVATNFALVRQNLGVERIVTLWQVHGNAVWQVDAHSLRDWHDGSELGTAIPGQPSLPQADAMITALPQTALCIRVADCVPVLFADPKAGVIAAAHAGRVGLLSGVLEATVQALRDAKAQEITAWIGPHICGSCYEVPLDMAQDAWEQLPATKASTAIKTPAIDLGRGAAAILEHLGCATHFFEPCTFEDRSYFSHRRDAGKTGRQAGIIWLAP